MIGYAFCGSFCTFSASLRVLSELAGSGEDIQPIMSERAYSTDTRFWLASEFVQNVEEVCKRKIIHTVAAAEPLGPKMPLDRLIVAPCTGNTLAKIASGITDSAVTMAVKALPTITPTDISTTLPRVINFLNSEKNAFIRTFLSSPRARSNSPPL